MLDFLPNWIEMIIFASISMIGGMLGGFLGIFLAARSEIKRGVVRARMLRIVKEKRDGQV